MEPRPGWELEPRDRHGTGAVSDASRPARRNSPQAVRDWLLREALTDFDPMALYASLCERLERAGVALLRAHISLRALHPLFRSVDYTWWRGEGIARAERPHAPSQSETWLRSPFYGMLERRLARLHQRLDDAPGAHDYPLFDDLRARGATDYYASLIPFGDPETAVEREDGVVLSWVSDRPDGFDERDVAAIESVQEALCVVARLAKHDFAARNVVAAYLGEDAGQRVLAGHIRLGDVERIPAVIWYSDMRGSTALADRLPAETFLEDLNAYFACAAGAALDRRGEVLRFIGDAVLAVFPIARFGSEEAAASAALDAAGLARERLAALNERRAGDGLDPLDFGLALHLGTVLYGNIGVATRVEFSVVGSAANEVARIQDLTKRLGEPLLVSSTFARTLSRPWRSLGRFELAGVGEAHEVLAP